MVLNGLLTILIFGSASIGRKSRDCINRERPRKINKKAVQMRFIAMAWKASLVALAP